MKVSYCVIIKNPEHHLVSVRLKFERMPGDNLFKVFLPSWSPGSYLMREYSRNIRWLKASDSTGKVLHCQQTEKGMWEIDFQREGMESNDKVCEIEYRVYCHELTVRTSYVDTYHAFLHGPSYLVGLKKGDQVVTMDGPEIEFRFPALWSNLHTGLTPIESRPREQFWYRAENYDALIDAPVEIGCHESDGFMVDGKEHYLAFSGEYFGKTSSQLKHDIKKIVETVSGVMGEIPYDFYTFITHFRPRKFGGLEHLNSTALQFDGRLLGDPEKYIAWLGLVAHEYFHTWNVKRIRPIELGPFDYTRENYTRMHWLTEGLTSFMDDLFVLEAGLCSLEDYLKIITQNLNRYFSIPGRKFHSLEESSFNAWIKLYRPDENSSNSSVSYYLKGGLVFGALNILLRQKGVSSRSLLQKLWNSFKARPETGLTKAEVLSMVEELGGKHVSDQFQKMLETTEEIDFESLYASAGLEFKWGQEPGPYLGANFSKRGNQVIVDQVVQDGPAYSGGLNAGDEIIFVNGQRFLASDISAIDKLFAIDRTVEMTVSRMDRANQIKIMPSKKPRKLLEIKITDRELASQFLSLN